MGLSFQNNIIPANAGEIHYYDPVTGTTITISAQSNGTNNFVKVSPATILDTGRGFDNGGANDGRLRHTAQTTETVVITSYVSALSANANDTIVMCMAFNGVLGNNKSIQKLGNTTDCITFSVTEKKVMAYGDYVEIYIANISSANNVIVKSLTIDAIGLS